MLNSLTHRIISSEFLQKQEMNEAIYWANICLEEGIETESILILASLNEKDGTWEIRNYLEQSLGQLGLGFLDSGNSLKCFIKSYILEILEDRNYESPLNKLYGIYMEFKQPKELRNFYLLYWANESWKLNHENKECYVDNFKPEKMPNFLEMEAKNWLDKNKIEFVNIEKIRVITSRDHDHAS